MSELGNQVVLITGCSTGIGRALAMELATRDHRVFATARRPESIEDLQSPNVERLALDVTDPASIERAVAAVVERAGRLDMVINNAGFNVAGPLAEVPLDDMRRIFETNVTGLLAVVQAVFPQMAQQRSGRIVNMGSVVGILPTPFAGPYCASKSAVHMLSDVLRMELEPFGIDVIVPQPGGVRSAISQKASQGLERYNQDSSRYKPFYAGIEKRAWSSQQNPMEAEEFARRLVPELLKAKPPRFVRLGSGSKVLPSLAKMPEPARDTMLMQQFGLLKRKS